MLEKQEACQLYIEQEIETGLADGKTKYAIGQEIAGWIEKLFGAKVKPQTIRVRADRYEEELVTNVTTGVMEMTPAREKIIENYEKREKKDTLVCKFTGDEENYTPAEYIERARIVMGSINTDPASNKLAQEIVMSDTYYTKDEDGLSKSWEGNIFLNPPYSHGVVDKFISKLIEELDETKQAILLTNNNTDTKWFHEAANNCALMCFTKGRISFYKEEGVRTSPVNGQTFFYFGPNTDLFKEIFSEIGLIMEVK